MKRVKKMMGKGWHEKEGNKEDTVRREGMLASEIGSKTEGDKKWEEGKGN